MIADLQPVLVVGHVEVLVRRVRRGDVAASTPTRRFPVLVYHLVSSPSATAKIGLPPLGREDVDAPVSSRQSPKLSSDVDVRLRRGIPSGNINLPAGGGDRRAAYPPGTVGAVGAVRASRIRRAVARARAGIVQRAARGVGGPDAERVARPRWHQRSRRARRVTRRGRLNRRGERESWRRSWRDARAFGRPDGSLGRFRHHFVIKRTLRPGVRVM